MVGAIAHTTLQINNNHGFIHVMYYADYCSFNNGKIHLTLNNRLE